MIAMGVAAASEAFALLGVPTPVLFAAVIVGIAYALLTRSELDPAPSAVIGAQAVIGVIVGTYVQRSTLTVIANHWLVVTLVCLVTLGISVLAGLLLARISPIDQATSSFGMIAGGAAGIISISHDLGADDRIVAVLQYIRVLIIVAAAPIVAGTVFGATASPAHSGVGAGGGWLMGMVFLVVCAAAGIPLARRLRIPAGALLGPMLVAAGLTLSGSALAAKVPMPAADVAFTLIGLQVGLRFTPASLRQARALLPAATAMIIAMIVISAFLGAILASVAQVSQLDGYLATTPGGLSAVLALSVGTRTNATFILSVQLIRTFVMLLAAPPLARWIAHRRSAIEAAH